MAVYLGTAGYTNRDWLGRFYAPGTRPAAWLGVYAAHFRAVELNSTFYGLPRPATLARMVTQTPGRVRFALKLPQSLTHRRDAGPAELVALRQAVQPLRDTGTLGPLVAQFPFSFGHNPSHWAYVTQLVESMALEGVVVEFRHASWHRPAVREKVAGLGGGMGFTGLSQPTRSATG